MSRQSLSLLIALFATLAPASFAVMAKPVVRIVPNKGESIAFKRVYSKQALEDKTLQMITRTDFTLTNTSGLLTGKWNATLRNIRNDETTNAKASSICKATGKRRVECAFGADNTTVILTAHSDGLLITIPVSQGVRFDKESAEGPVLADHLLGTDDSNNIFKLAPKKL